MEQGELRVDGNETVEFMPYGEVRGYRFIPGWTTGPLTHGVSIAREDKDGRFFGGCMSDEQVMALIHILADHMGVSIIKGHPKPEEKKTEINVLEVI